MLVQLPKLNILVFPGGGALGAFQAGFFEAFDQAAMEPNWVVGTSIGAINAAIIAGNPPNKRLNKLQAFWNQMAFNLANGRFDLMLDNSVGAKLVSHWSIMTAFAYGMGGFFKPRTMREFALGFKTSPKHASFYTTNVLEDTLKEMVDFDYLQNSPVRLSMGAVDIQSGAMVYFDSQTTQINVQHIMASSALPPAFPPVEVDGRFYWDGGIYSNTPLEWVLRNRPEMPSLCLQASLWQQQDDLPVDLASVLRRSKELQFSSRDEAVVQIDNVNHHLHILIERLAALAPPNAIDKGLRQAIAKVKRKPALHLVSLESERLHSETHNKYVDFSSSRIQQRWQAGHKTGVHVLQEAPWQKPVEENVGIVHHPVVRLQQQKG